MTIKELDDKLNDPGFQDPKNGDIFYNFFIYQYDAHDEYDIRAQIMEFKENLIRPTNYVDVLCLNLFDEFCHYLSIKSIMHRPMLEYQLEKEKTNPDATMATLSRNAHSEGFIRYLHEHIMAHVNIRDDQKRPYIFVYGIGSMYPYIRVNELLTLYEQYNETWKYKIIVFYPGHRDNNSFKLFGLLPDHHTYRATLLINE